MGAFWISPDGRTWTRIADDAPGTGLTGVARGSFGYVAVGGGDDDSCAVCYDAGPPIWSSSDGATWRLEGPEAVTPRGDGWAWAMTTTVDGRIVAVGQGGTHGDLPGPLVWTSGDGQHWAAHPIRDQRSGGTLLAVTRLASGGLVAVGYGAIWGSPDGIAWTVLAVLPTSRSDPPLRSVACGPDRCVAAGWDISWDGLALWVGPARATP